MLPTIKANVRVYNQNYVVGDEFMFWEIRDVEVLTLNLNAGTMRVRFADSYQGKMKNVTQDISINAFYDQFEIVKK